MIAQASGMEVRGDGPYRRESAGHVATDLKRDAVLRCYLLSKKF